MRIIEINLNLNPGGHAPAVHVNQGDTDFTLLIHLYNSRGRFTMESGTTAKLRGTKPDGSTYTRTASISGMNVTVAGGTDMTSAAGKGLFEVCLTHGGKELYTQNFPVYVEDKAKGD